MKTILITGVSSGLGLAIADEALARGHRVVGTLRQDEQRAAFEAKAPGRSVGRLLDVTDTGSIAPLVDAMEEAFGIDVLVNNAGYGLRGFMEELDLDALRRQFDVNLFGPIALIQAALPGMRRRRTGHIVNMASMGGMVTFPGLGAYHGTKFALLGMSDALAKEVAPLGIKVTSVLPGVYRSDWRGRSLARSEAQVADYDDARSTPSDLAWGDPGALGRVVLDAVEMETPPERLLVGPTAIRMVRETIDRWSAEIDRWERLSQADGEG